MALEQDRWLSRTREDPLDPSVPLCDPHHHLWDHPQSRYLLDELVADAAGHNVVKTVFVECMSIYDDTRPEAFAPIGETEFVESIAEQSASSPDALQAATGIVSFADLSLGAAVDEVLDAHEGASPGRFRGIRHASGWHADEAIRNSHTRPPEGLLLDSTFRKGFGCLARRGLSFDAWLYHSQLSVTRWRSSCLAEVRYHSEPANLPFSTSTQERLRSLASQVSARTTSQRGIWSTPMRMARSERFHLTPSRSK